MVIYSTMGSQIRTKNHPQDLAAKYVKDPEKVVYLQPVREFHHVCMYQVDAE